MKLFQNMAAAAVIAVYLVILAGAVVRATGSGMGCPSWPKCFDRWVPPTEVSELPPDYQTRYQVAGRPAEAFNVYKTWTEYLNRLLGAVLGLIVIGMAAAAWRIRRERPQAFWLSLAAVLIVAFEGWLGKLTVDTYLQPVKVTLHMVFALLAAFCILLAAYGSRLQPLGGKLRPALGRIQVLLGVALALSLAQTWLGTSLREAIDEIAARSGYESRNLWVEGAGMSFYVHRSFSILLVLCNGWLVYELRGAGRQARLLAWGLAGLIVAQVLTGMALSYLGFPPAMQPAHLFLYSLMCGVQFLLLISVIRSRNGEHASAGLHSAR